MSIKNNTTSLQSLLEQVNSLPEVGGGIELPELSNEGSAADLMSGKQLIDGDGNVVDGTFTIDTELDTQDNLISQIQTALQNKVAATGEDVTVETTAYTNKLATLETAITALETELQGKASGGSVGWINVTSLPSIYAAPPDELGASTYYYEVPDNCIGIACIGTPNVEHAPCIIASTNIAGSFNTVQSSTSTLLRLSDADGTGTVIKIETAYLYTYFLPILSSDLS